MVIFIQGVLLWCEPPPPSEPMHFMDAPNYMPKYFTESTGLCQGAQ